MTKLDIIVYGATGFTGKIVVEKIKKLSEKYPYSELSWGIAGRSKEKLEKLISEIFGETITSEPHTQAIPLIVAETTDEASLRSMTETARCMINCTGPYTRLGEPVVKACIETGTHYVDMTAELHFMLEMYKKYNTMAVEANVLIITACGYGSMPAALGMVHLEKHFKGTLNSVECYTELQIPTRAYFPGCDNTLVHYGTWASLVCELKNFRSYQVQKAERFPDDSYGPQKLTHGFLHRHNRKFWFPYPGPDRDAVDISERFLQKHRSKKPVKFNIYTTMPWLIHLVLLIPVFFFYYYASYMACFRKMLLKFPRFFTLGYISHKGPSKRNLEELKYSFLLNGTGVADEDMDGRTVEKKMTVKVFGVDPYAVTALVLMMAAVTVVREGEKMQSGGVLMPGAAFYDTNIVENLNTSSDIKFEIL